MKKTTTTTFGGFFSNENYTLAIENIGLRNRHPEPNKSRTSYNQRFESQGPMEAAAANVASSSSSRSSGEGINETYLSATAFIRQRRPGFHLSLRLNLHIACPVDKSPPLSLP